MDVNWGKVALGTGLAAVVFFGGRRLLRQARADDAAKQAGSDPSVSQAMRIREAITLGGKVVPFPTNEEALYAVAGEIADWPSVARRYAATNNGANIITDLETALSAEELAKFFALVRKEPISGYPQWRRRKARLARRNS